MNYYYNVTIAFIVFTSTLKFSKMISFHRVFDQISDTLKMIFNDLAAFMVEFFFVFAAFASFFFFVLNNDLDNFRDEVHTVEYTLAMSIGKFNFMALRRANVVAAWAFFVFSSNMYYSS